jgi:hypothetical protein
VVGKYIFSLRDIHALQLGNVLLKFIYRLGSILLFDDALDILNLLAENALQGIKMLVSHILEDIIIVCQDEGLSWRKRSRFFVIYCIRLDDRGIHGDGAGLYPEEFVDLPLIGLIHAKW